MRSIWSHNLSLLTTKPAKWLVRPAKTQLSIGIHPDWSESSLSAWRNVGFLATHKTHGEDWSDRANAQADQSSLGAHAILLVLSCCGSFVLQQSCSFVRKWSFMEVDHFLNQMYHIKYNISTCKRSCLWCHCHKHPGESLVWGTSQKQHLIRTSCYALYDSDGWPEKEWMKERK